MAESKPMWQRIGVDSDLERGPVSVPIVPHRGGHLELLPFDALTWPDFESLLWRILRDVEGLRHAQIYGDPGQAQLGLDIIAEAADGTGVALQSKRVAQFGPAKFTAAVNEFRKTNRPFPVSRFILGISREIRSTPAVDRFKELQRDLKQESKPVALELWDRRELSQRLKRAPAIVIDYFGKEIAEIFVTPSSSLQSLCRAGKRSQYARLWLAPLKKQQAPAKKLPRRRPLPRLIRRPRWIS